MTATEQLKSPVGKGKEPVKTGLRTERQKLAVLVRVAEFEAGMTPQRRADLALAGAIYRKDAADQGSGEVENVTVRPPTARVGTILIRSANGEEVDGIEEARKRATVMLAEAPEEV